MTDVSMMSLAWAICGAGMCATGMVIFHLKKNQRLILKNRLDPGRTGRGSGNLDKAILQSLKQIELSFGAVADVIKQERHILTELIQKSEDRTTKHPPHLRISGKTFKSGSGTKRVRDRADNGKEKQAFDRYNTIARLADTGLDPEEISRRMRIPRGEIELILKFKSLWQKSGAVGRTGLHYDKLGKKMESQARIAYNN